MSRLIDADKLKDNIIKCLKPLDPEEEMIAVDVALLSTIMEIDNQSTAFDVDKVVEQLEELKMRYFLTIANTGDTDKDCAYKNIANTIDKAVEIVKGGGIK